MVYTLNTCGPFFRSATLATLLTVSVAISPAYSEFRSLKIGSENMLPTLQVGDAVGVASYAPNEPIERGDLVAYEVRVKELLQSAPTDVIFVGRIIGLPRETIEMRHGNVVVDGKPFGTSPLLARADEDCPKDSSFGTCRFLREITPEGSSYVTLDLVDETRFDNTKPKTMGPDEYFIMGDNRDNSADARIYGPTARTRIVGKVRGIWASLSPNYQRRFDGYPDLK